MASTTSATTGHIWHNRHCLWRMRISLLFPNLFRQEAGLLLTLSSLFLIEFWPYFLLEKEQIQSPDSGTSRWIAKLAVDQFSPKM